MDVTYSLGDNFTVSLRLCFKLSVAHPLWTMKTPIKKAFYWCCRWLMGPALAWCSDSRVRPELIDRQQCSLLAHCSFLCCWGVFINDASPHCSVRSSLALARLTSKIPIKRFKLSLNRSFGQTTRYEYTPMTIPNTNSRDGSVGWLVHHFSPVWNISTTIRWIAVALPALTSIYCHSV